MLVPVFAYYQLVPNITPFPTYSTILIGVGSHFLPRDKIIASLAKQRTHTGKSFTFIHRLEIARLLFFSQPDAEAAGW